MLIHEKTRKLAVVLILGIVIIVAAQGLITAVIGYREFTSVLEQQYNDTAYEIAETALGYLNADKLRVYMDTLEKDDEYNEIEAQLDALTNAASCNFIYVAYIDQSNLLKTTYIFDSLNDSMPFNRYPLGYTAEDMDPKYLEDIELVLNGGRSTKYAYSYGESGAHTTAALSVKDSTGQVVAMIFVEKPMTALENARTSYVRHISLSVAIIIVSVIVLFASALQSFVIQPIHEITEEARRFAIDHKESEAEFKPMKNRYEIGVLARSIKKMENDIHEYFYNLNRVTAEKERIGAELNVATQIQANMLPRIFPAFPDHKEFDIFASMNPAKEVGGDFYDFFLVDEKHIALVMADVSGKGVPAALFMVIAKTLIKNRAQLGGTPAEILNDVNSQLIEGNEAELFVTVWLAIIDITTGEGMAANAGHEHPVVRRKDGSYELVIYRHSPAVATMDGIRFREHAFKLNPGDRLFVYTDGVPEATNAANELFGTDRMLAALSAQGDTDPEQLLHGLKRSISDFVGDAEQFDDITMLCFDYFGRQAVEKELTLDATVENLDDVLAFVDEQLMEQGCPMKTQLQIDVAVEEMFVNIAHYAYAPEVGQATVRVKMDPTKRMAEITFIDRGMPFNPLQREDPDVTLAIEDRSIGGLGIYMTKKSMDSFEYRYEDGQNILTIGKKL